MGVCYDMISDAAREGYELGKGPWAMAEFNQAIRSADPVAQLVALFAEEEPGFAPDYALRIAQEIVAFAAAHSDWRVVDDCGGWDGAVVDDEWRAVLVDEGRDPMDHYFPLYRQTGSRFAREPAMPGTIAWENLTERQREVILRFRSEHPASNPPPGAAQGVPK